MTLLIVFPDEIAYCITSHMSINERCCFRKVCKSFNEQSSVPDHISLSCDKIICNISESYEVKFKPSLSESASTNLYKYIRDKLADISDRQTRGKLLTILFNNSYKSIQSKNTSHQKIDEKCAYKTLSEEVYYGVGIASIENIEW